jgi:hypothetical protein
MPKLFPCLKAPATLETSDATQLIRRHSLPILKVSRSVLPSGVESMSEGASPTTMRVRSLSALENLRKGMNSFSKKSKEAIGDLRKLDQNIPDAPFDLNHVL